MGVIVKPMAIQILIYLIFGYIGSKRGSFLPEIPPFRGKRKINFPSLQSYKLEAKLTANR